MSDFFTKNEIIEVSNALKDVTGAGIDIKRYSTNDEQLQTFYDKAKLWRVIERIISVLYIKRLSSGQMFLKDNDGLEYEVIPRRKTNESKNP